VRHLGPRLAGIRPPLRAGVAAVAAVTLLALALARPVYQLPPEPQVVELGGRAAEVTPAGEPVYSLNWYAPALGDWVVVRLAR
jgi:hypothetical protein